MCVCNAPNIFIIIYIYLFVNAAVFSFICVVKCKLLDALQLMWVAGHKGRIINH